METYGGNYPKNSAEWWELVDKFWFQLLGILWKFIPMDGYGTYDDQILSHLLCVEIEALKNSRDRDLARYFNGAWAAAPDNSSIHEIPGWALLCDLCSEESVLDDVEE